MHIEYTISAEDYIAAQKQGMRYLKPTQERLLFQWLPTLGLVLLVFLLYTGFAHGFSSSLAPGFIFPVFFLSLLITRNSNLRKTYAKATNMHGNLLLDVDDDGLHFQGATFKSQVTWEHYSSFFEDQRSFLLFQKTPIFNIIPKQQLSPEQVAALKELFLRQFSEGGKIAAAGRQ
jgi:hypothetical protein